MLPTDHDALFERAERLCLEAVANPALEPDHRAANVAAKNLEYYGWKRTTGMTQHSIILKHLRKAGSITVREAIVEYSIQSLTKRIQELRELGHGIISHVRFHPITGQKYVRYSFT